MDISPENYTYVKETSKVSEITDKYGNLRFKVILENALLGGNYAVRILLCGENEEELANRPFSDYGAAIKFFEDNVSRYVRLVKAEEYDIHDIRAYAERIGYRQARPECCFTCRWSRQNDLSGAIFADDDHVICQKLFCMHPAQYRQRDGRKDEQQVEIHPAVDALHVCDSFAFPLSGENDERYGGDPSDYGYRLPFRR